MSANGREMRTFRGKTLAEVLPRIRQDLGPDAVITRQREGLQGGIAGFFQKQFVEVEAHAGNGAAAPAEGGRLLDVYDPGDELAAAEGMTSPAIQALMQQAAPFADQLAEAQNDLDFDGAEPAYEPEPQQAADSRQQTPVQPVRRFKRTRPAQADAIENTLIGAGLSARLASAIVTETVAHLLPFDSPRELRKLVRRELARRIPVQSAWAGVGRRIGFVGTGGSGKTLCTARLATTYADAGDRPVLCLSYRPKDGGAELTELLRAEDLPVDVVNSAEEARVRIADLGDDAVVVVDTPAVNPTSPESIDALAEELGRFLYEVHLTLPATTSTPAAQEIVAELGPLGVSRFALTHVDSTSHIGGAVELAIRNSKPFSFTGQGTSMPEGLEPADAHALASLILP
jgi:flagellar biosynthesis GTPase FlhF